MKQDVFIARHELEWEALTRWLEQQQQRKKKPGADPVFPADEFPERYRRLCQQLSLARVRGYSPVLVERLQALVRDCHQHLYQPARPDWGAAGRFFRSGFPRLVRREKNFVLFSALLFFLPFFLMLIVLQHQPQLVYGVFNAPDVAEFESMYDPEQHAVRLARDSESDLVMFGYYIMNNVSIGFRTMASGLFAGVGSMFVLVMNGVIIGAVAGHLTAVGYTEPFWGFVAGHSAPELLGIVISGAAGLRLGFALIAPGRLSRRRALVEAARVSARLVLGVFGMLVFAAFVEAFWSSIVWMPVTVKYSVGVVMWLLMLAWLFMGGRRDEL